MNYNFVFFQVPHDYYKISMNDVFSLSNVKYYDNYPYFGGKFLRFLHKVHFSGKILPIISLPFKKIWNPYYFENTFADDKPICFIFTGATAIWAKSGLISYLKSKYNKSRFVCFYQDIIESYKFITLYEIKHYFDIVMSYNKTDAEKYGLLYHPTQYSSIEIPKNDFIPYSDVYFLGAAKNRFESIIKAFEYFKANGLKCDFYVTDVPRKERKYTNEIKYIKHMSYIENLQHIDKTKAILELMQEKSTGFTLRMWEAITYEKLLITNNKAVEKLKDNSNGFVVLNNPNNNWQDLLNLRVKYDSSWEKQMSVKHFLEFIENNL